MSDFVDKILLDVCLDDRIPDAIFDMGNSTHMQVLFENLVDNGVNINDARMVHNKMVEGKYPERQAYNRDGLLVTFPTPAHKQKAIQRGTHFEEDPTKKDSNVFGANGPQQGQPQQSNSLPQDTTPSSTPGPNAKVDTTPPQSSNGEPSQLPASDSGPESSGTNEEPSNGEPSQLPASDSSNNSESPATDNSISNIPPSAPPTPPPPAPTGPGGQKLEVEPSAASNQKSPPPNFDIPKTPEQKVAEADYIKKIMSGSAGNDQTLSLTEQIALVEVFCKERKYNKALNVINGIKKLWEQ